MSLFSLINKNSNISVNNKLFSVSNFCQLKFPVTYYMSLLNDDKTLILNVSPSYRSMYYHGKTVLLNNQDNNSKIIIEGMNTVSHNFTLIDNITSKEIWGVGGCGKKANKDYTEGIYLLYSKNNMKSWKIFDTIIKAKNTKGWNPKGDSTFDSNITCFYSNILKKNVIFTRYNIGGGSRGIQVFHSNHIKRGWDNGRLCNINTYKLKENYYMNKVIEIKKFNIFLMVSPFSDLKRRSKTGLKFLVSRDTINWIDCGIFKEATPVDKHSSTPNIQPVALRFDENNDKLSVYYHDNYFSKTKSNIFKMVCDINSLFTISYKKKAIVKFVTIVNSHRLKLMAKALNKTKNHSAIIKINKKNYVFPEDKILDLDNSLTLNKKYNVELTLENVILSGFKFI